MISFTDFIGAMYDGRRPYPWQERFAARCAAGQPPGLVGVPTGCGKTTVVDALVWALASQAHLAPAERTVGARIVWAIDRRILVDQVHKQASKLAAKLAAAEHDQADPLHEMASRLASMSGAAPLVATRWRGGIAPDRSLHPPAQVQVITSTVAQVGSRLLFRGYGVGRRSLALEAGLTACDTTICLDEAHLAEPFRQTVTAIAAHRAATERALRLPTLGLITLTATPGVDEPDAIRLGDDDREVPELRRRLYAKKAARLEESPATERDRVRLIAQRATTYVEGGAKTVACVVNTVKRARDVFDQLDRDLTHDEAQLALLVGPQRPADRELLLAQHTSTLFNGTTPDRPLICVATQTFEVGLDADVAAMVTDSASASALVQRLGRLNRGGHGSGDVTVVRDGDTWLYEHDEPHAWEWLRSLVGPDGVADVSVIALQDDRSRPAPARQSSAPSLTPSVVELLAQTNPSPGPWQEPSVDVFLRGADDQSATDVTVCWRRDLLPHCTATGADAYRTMLLTLVPPQHREQLTLSVRAARALLAARYAAGGKPGKAATVALSDVDVEGGVAPASVPVARADAAVAPFLLIRHGEILHGTLEPEKDEGRVAIESLRPGDQVVLPTEAGGVDRHGLAPSEPGDAEQDVAGDRRAGEDDGERLPAPVRISPAALGRKSGHLAPALWRKVVAAVGEDPGAGTSRGPAALVRALLELRPDHPGLLALNQLASGERRARVVVRSIRPVGRDGMPMLSASEIALLEDDPTADEAPAQDSPSPEPDELQPTWVLVPIRERERDRPGTATPPTLEAHANSVRDEVKRFASRAGLPTRVLSAVLLAAAAHDHGKADPRTQSFFYGGISPLGGERIAKSVFGTDDPRAAATAQQLAGLPSALRHEVASVAVLAEWLTASGHDEVDADLALHLVACHHGEGRPIPSVPTGGRGPSPFHVDVAGIEGTGLGDGQDGWADGEWLRRYARVLGRYGEWGTAYLEALLIVADRSVSARGD